MEIDFDHPLFVICGICGVIFFITGLLLYFFPPKKINGLYGYRTSNSMKTQERWDFAQKYSAKGMVIMGVIMVFVTPLSMVLNPDSLLTVVVIIGSFLVPLIILFINTENNIKNKFPEK